MAGIGFTLKKLYKEEQYSSRVKTYLYASLVAAGPWIAAVLTMNMLIFYANVVFDDISEMGLFMGSIVYAFIFSQIITAPFQLVITRYISDMLFKKDYDNITASYRGLINIIVVITAVTSFLYLYNTSLPLYYKYLSAFLYMLISVIWITMVYLGAIRNYIIISKAFIYGGLVSAVLSIITIGDLRSLLGPLYDFLNLSFDYGPIYSIPFGEIEKAGNLFVSYVLGMLVAYIMLSYSFKSSFRFSNNKNYDFLRYLSLYPSLFLSGMFYTLGLWIDDLLMWYSDFGFFTHFEYQVYKYAPLYDNAVFFAYLTIIPTMVLFLISIETEFYDFYKKYFTIAGKDGTYENLKMAKEEMRKSIYRQLIYTLETQTIITTLVIVVSGRVFSYFNLPIILKDIFRICALGALCNVFVLLIFLILLYFEARKQALFITVLFFLSNLVFTILFIPLGEKFFGFGYFTGSFITFITSLVMLFAYFRKIEYYTFGRQPLFFKEPKGIFISIANRLNKITEIDIEEESKENTS